MTEHTHTHQSEFTVMLLRLTLQVLEHDFSNSLLIVLIFYSTNPENVPDPATFEVRAWVSSSTPEYHLSHLNYRTNDLL